MKKSFSLSSVSRTSDSALRRPDRACVSKLILRHLRAATQEYLLDVRLGRARGPANSIGAHGSIAPAQNRQTLFFGDALDDAFADQPLLRFDGQEHHAHAIGARFG